MILDARAPGKLVICGEYAVVEQHPPGRAPPVREPGSEARPGGACSARLVAVPAPPPSAGMPGSLPGLGAPVGLHDPVAPPHPLLPGQRIGRYDLERSLDANESGVSYAAVDRVSGERLAVKEFLPARLVRRSARPG